MKRGAVKTTTKTSGDLYPKTEIFCKGGDEGDFAGEDIRGADGKPIYPGRTVRCLPHKSASLRVTVPTSFGKVTRLYRQDGCSNPETGCDVIVQTDNGHSYYADQCVRSSAGEADDAEHERRLKSAQEDKIRDC